MKTKNRILDNLLSGCFVVLLLISTPSFVFATTNTPVSGNRNQDNYSEYKGIIVDRKSNVPLAFASLTVVGTNISSVSNSEGEFILKIDKAISDPKVSISFIGYKNKVISLTFINPDKQRIEMEPSAVELPEINVISKDAEALIMAVLEKKGENYSAERNLMTAFYRETIKKNRTYVSLSEAVVEIYKQPINSYKSDIAELYKARKKADYSKLDTVSFKLMGGPFNSLYLDIMKNPEMIFTENMIANYEFSFDRSTRMDNRLIYILDFRQRQLNTDPLYYGKLYIDAQNLALKSAIFKLNIVNKELASRMFILKKPFNANVYPIDASYRIDYLEKDGKWFYNYSRIELGLKMNWKKKLFNTNYHTTIEMAVTDWEKYSEKKEIDKNDRLKPSVIISDESFGFSNPQFWGEYNVIEPEKSIETAIKKIQKQLEKR